MIFTQKNIRKLFATLLASVLLSLSCWSQTELENCNITWTSQSKNSAESMPCGGGSIGLNVWTENNEILFYMARSGSFDENNALLKAGRVRLRLFPNPFSENFKQELDLKTGAVKISGSTKGMKADVLIWVDVFKPVVHVEMQSSKPLRVEASYENWRYRDRPSRGKANNANSYKWAPQGEVQTWKDEIAFENNSVLFYHRNKPFTVFDVTVKQQGLDSVKAQLYNPLDHLTFGGQMEGPGLKPAGTTSGTYLDTDFKGWKLVSNQPVKRQELLITLHTEQATGIAQWMEGLQTTRAASQKNSRRARTDTHDWWKEFWDRSYVFINPGKSESDTAWQVGRNYQLFRYMLGCNAYGDYPTKFNGGLFTYDPSLVDTALKFTPDFRNWGGGTFTAQNQRLVYFPLIKSGDFELLKPQFDFYLRLLKNAELRSKVYWKHAGASFTEQLENFGLPNPAEYGWKRPEGYDPGMQYNAWLEYQWDTALEFCLMILETERYAGKDIHQYLPLIESCLRFFNEHYQYLAKQRGVRSFDDEGHLVLYPGSGAETYKMAYNATSTIAALKTVLTRLLELPSDYLNEKSRSEWATMLQRIPPISFTEMEGHPTIAPAKVWQFIANKNRETVQLYPVFPWGIYGVGKPDLAVALNTWKYDTTVVKFKSHVGWRQYNIFAPRLGLVKEAAELNRLKLQNSGRRFPAFWGPGYDWVPDHNWGGSGMIGLQEMLLQTNGSSLLLFPAWPKDWDVHFKLHAPGQTTVEASLKNGKVEWIKVVPEARTKDIINLLNHSQ